MKKTGLLIVGMFALAALQAQTLTIQGGTTFSRLKWFDGGDSDFKQYEKTLIGYSGFVGVDYLEKKHFNLSTNAGFIRKGGKEINEFRDETGAKIGEDVSKVKLDYVSINTMASVKAPINDKFTAFLSAGPRFDYLLSCKSEYGELDFDNQWAKPDRNSYGMIVGGGLKYSLSAVQVGVRADYYIECNEIADWIVWPDGNTRITSQTYSVNLTLGYKL